MQDRQVSMYAAALIITLMGAIMTYAIVRSIFSIDFAMLTAAANAV